MNKAHHGRRQEIRAAEVWQCTNDLSQLLDLAEAIYEECYRWRRRDSLKDESATPAPPPLPVTPIRAPLDIWICPDLAAFTQNTPTGDSQESPERLSPNLLDNTVTYYLRRPAIAGAFPTSAADRRLVIARHRDATYARRLVRGVDADFIGLTADVPDPRTRTPKTLFLREIETSIHQVIGVIFDHSFSMAQGQDEAVLVDASAVFDRVRVAFRVIDDSAVPLALEKQIVLGGNRIELSELGQHSDRLAALTLDDGSSLFKRIGAALPGDLDNLRQFESVGGLGSSHIFAVGRPQKGFRTVVNARGIIGVLYHS
jgi:hypothetical protein